MTSGSVIVAFLFEGLLTTLLWAVIAVLNFWIWKKAKANANLLMLIGSGWLALAGLLALFNVGLLGWQNSGWTMLLGVACLAIGFYLSVKPMVEANIAQLQAKVKETMGKKGGGSGTGGASGAGGASGGTPAK